MIYNFVLICLLFAAEEEEVSFKFVGYDHMLTLPWSELDLDETPFGAYQEIAVDQCWHLDLMTTVPPYSMLKK